MEKINPEKSKTKIQKIVERTFNRLKELEQNGRIEILEEETIKNKLLELFEMLTEENKKETQKSFWEVYVTAKKFVEGVLKENLIKILGEDKEAEEENRQFLINIIKENIYIFGAYKEI